MPGEQQNRDVILAPPRGADSQAGRTPVDIQIYSQNAERRVSQATALIHIEPFQDFQVEMQPEVVRTNQFSKVLVKNHGNQPESYQVEWLASCAFNPHRQPSRLFRALRRRSNFG
jgi:hypothetical protein